LRYDETKPAYVDWGDGTSYEVKSDLQQLVHEYAAPGEYVVKLYNLKSIAVSTFNAAWRNKESQVAFTLKEVTCLGELMSEVQDMAFFRCKALEAASLPLSLPSVGAMAFRDCRSLKHVDLPAAERLGKGLCWECSSLQEAKVQEGTKKVGNYAFRDCTSLTSVSLPASVEHVEQDTFSGCSSIEVFNVAEGNKHYVTCSGALMTADKKTLVHGTTHSAEVPEGAEEVGDWAFYAMSLSSISLPQSLKKVGHCAFAGCRNLEELLLPSGLQTVGRAAFMESGLVEADLCST